MKCFFGGIKNKKYTIYSKYVIYGFLFLLTLFMHLFYLDRIPYGLHIDEAGMAYDAYCLANYSVDRYLKHFPVYLINYGGGQSSLYAYMTAFFVWLTGDVNIWTIRLPAALIAILAYLAGVMMVRKCAGEKWGMTAAFLLAIFPYFTMQSRFGLDCNLQLGFTTIGLWLIIKAFTKKKNYLFFAAGLIWGISYYTYALSYISTTLFLFAALTYLLFLKKINLKNLAIFCIPVVCLGIPLAIMVLRNKAGMPELLVGPFTIPRLGSFRGSEITVSNILENMVITLKVIMTRDRLDYNAFDIYYTMYPISIPFAVIGFITVSAECVRSIQKRYYSIWCIFWFLFLSNLAVSLLLGGNGPNINKANGIFFALFIMVILGIKETCTFIRRKKLTAAKLFFSIVILAYSVFFVFFAKFYFIDYPKDIYPQYLFDDTYEEILSFLNKNTENDKVVYVDTTYIYHYLSARLDPYVSNVGENGPDSFENFIFTLPEQIDEDASYIVKEINESYIQKLEKKSFLPRQRDGQFILYCKY